MSENLESQFASAERASPGQLEKDAGSFASNHILNNIANAVSSMVVILNQQRQIVFANAHFLKFLKTDDSAQIIGKRPGEAVNCMHSASALGCGTTEFCRTCGAVGAILEAQVGKFAEQECRIIDCSNDAMDFRITASPYTDDGNSFTIFAIQDISDEKRRQTLERVFFHDVLNSAGGISGLSSILQLVENPEDIKLITKKIHRAAENMLEEIQAQRQLNAAERGELEPEFSPTTISTLLNDVADLFTEHEIFKNKTLLIPEERAEVVLNTDPVILRRILINMVKNAMEASPAKGTVKVSFEERPKSILFSVHNSSWIPRDVQLQLFKRSFSTKGTGRGIGTYSMKILGEKYLKGKVWYKSSPENGTFFYIAVPKNDVK